MEIQIDNNPSSEKLQNLDVSSWGVWEKETSSFPWSYDEQESCYILEGEAEITPEDGEKVVIKSGDFVVFPKGLKCTWDIKKPIKKHYKFG
ncbi:MAG: DUF861 domain-containing protein [Candidatus Moranbacteria bacterium]|nr:DUF861 domain-containing protein [Candidatus Moranbacteria bacterium]